MKYLKLIFCIVPITLLIGCFYEPSEYPPPGRNTVEIFGDGRFEIFSGVFENQRYYCLYDRKENQEGQIEGNIINYIEICPYIYIIGTCGADSFNVDASVDSESIYYTKVNYETGELIQNIDINFFLETDKKIFDNLFNRDTNSIKN